MANYYLQFCEAFFLEDHEKVWFEEWLGGLWEAVNPETGELKSQYECIDHEMIEYLGFGYYFQQVRNPDRWRMVIDTDESGTPDHVLNAMSCFLEKWRPNEFFTMTWASWSSRSEPGQFGGGWGIATGEKIRAGTAYDRQYRFTEYLMRHRRDPMQQET